MEDICFRLKMRLENVQVKISLNNVSLEHFVVMVVK